MDSANREFRPATHDDDVPAKAPQEWNARRLTFLAILCLSTVTCITCSIMGDKTLPAILAFGLMVISVWELQQKPEKSVETPAGLEEELEEFLSSNAKKSGIDLERFMKGADTAIESKVLMRVLIKDYLRVVGRLQKYEPMDEDTSTTSERGDVVIEMDDSSPANQGAHEAGGHNNNNIAEPGGNSAKGAEAGGSGAAASNLNNKGAPPSSIDQGGDPADPATEERRGSLESDQSGKERKEKKEKKKKDESVAEKGDKGKKEKKKKKNDTEE